MNNYTYYIFYLKKDKSIYAYTTSKEDRDMFCLTREMSKFKLRKEKLLSLVKENVTNRLRNSGVNAVEINEIVSKLFTLIRNLLTIILLGYAKFY